MPPTLRDRIDANVWNGSLDDVLEQVAKHATVTRGQPVPDPKGLALSLLTTFPDDYVEFLRRSGSLRVEGDSENYGFGQLEVFGVQTLADARRRFREECDGWTGNANWRQASEPRYAQLQRAYREMVPVIQFSDVMHQGVDCFGRDGRMHVVDIKSWQIEPDHGRTFTAQLLERLAGVIVR